MLGGKLWTLSVTFCLWASLNPAFKPQQWLFQSERVQILAVGRLEERRRLKRTRTLAFSRGRNIFCTSLDMRTHESGDFATAVILSHSQPSRFDEFQQQLMNLSSGSCCLKVARWLLAPFGLKLMWSTTSSTLPPPLLTTPILTRPVVLIKKSLCF